MGRGGGRRLGRDGSSVSISLKAASVGPVGWCPFHRVFRVYTHHKAHIPGRARSLWPPVTLADPGQTCKAAAVSCCLGSKPAPRSIPGHAALPRGLPSGKETLQLHTRLRATCAFFFLLLTIFKSSFRFTAKPTRKYSSCVSSSPHTPHIPWLHICNQAAALQLKQCFSGGAEMLVWHRPA